MREPRDFKRYFESLIEVSRKNRAPHVIGMINLNGIIQFLIKIKMFDAPVDEPASQNDSVLSRRVVVFTISTYESFRNLSQYLVNYLCFLFTI